MTIQNKANDYFKSLPFGTVFDIIFIDASHDFEDVKQDFENSIKVLNTNGIIIFDDTDPCNEDLAKADRCFNTYLINDYIRDNYKELDIVVLPILCKGMTIVNRRCPSRFITKI